MMQDNFQHQIVQTPRRGVNILDVVLSDQENLVHNTNIGGSLGSLYKTILNEL